LWLLLLFWTLLLFLLLPEQEEKEAENTWMTEPEMDDILAGSEDTAAVVETEEEIVDIEEGTAANTNATDTLEGYEEAEFGFEDDAWYWDETPETYSDDAYEDDYWVSCSCGGASVLYIARFVRILFCY
jgi:hypothetical protein